MTRLGQYLVSSTKGVEIDLLPNGQINAQGDDGSFVVVAPTSTQQPTVDTPSYIPPSKVISTLQSGHGFTVSGAGSSNLNDTSDFMLGTQSVSMVSNGAGSSAILQKTAMTPFDASNCYILVWFKIDDYTFQGGSFSVYMGDTNFTNRYAWNIKQTNQAVPWAIAGEWVAYKLSFATASVTGSPTRSAITDVRIFITDNSLGTITLRCNGFALVKDPATTFPNGVVSLTFDDSLISQYSVAKPILDGFGFPATAYTIESNVGTAACMSVSQLTSLQKYSNWEIAHHAYSDALHSATYTGVPISALEQDMQLGKQWLKDNGFKGHNHTAYPLGQYNTDVLTLTRKYFSSARSIFQGQTETFAPCDLMRLRVGYIINTTTLSTVEGWVDSAFSNREWLILVNHKLVPTPSVSTEWKDTDYQSLIAYIAAKGIPVRTVGDVLKNVS